MFQPRTDAVAAPSATAADAGNGGGSFEEQEAALSAEEAATLRADRAQCMEWINEHALYDAALATFPDHVNRSMRRMVLLAYGRHLVQERCTNDALLAFSLAAPQDVYVTRPRRRATLHQGCSHRSPVCYWSPPPPLLSFQRWCHGCHSCRRRLASCAARGPKRGKAVSPGRQAACLRAGNDTTTAQHSRLSAAAGTLIARASRPQLCLSDPAHHHHKPRSSIATMSMRVFWRYVVHTNTSRHCVCRPGVSVMT